MNAIEQRRPLPSLRGVIHQPYFLPWLGYFSKLVYCDVFVVLDNVSFSKRHYQDRTRIVNTQGEIAWLSLPTGQNLSVPIGEVQLRPPSESTIPKIIRTLKLSYSQADFFNQEWPILESIVESCVHESQMMLLQLNLCLIREILTVLGVKAPQVIMASEVTRKEGTTTRILDICSKLHLRQLVVGAGKSQAVHDLNVLKDQGVDVLVQDYLQCHPQYSQTRRRRLPFTPGLSVVDALLNVGAEEVREYLERAECAPRPLGDSLCSKINDEEERYDRRI